MSHASDQADSVGQGKRADRGEKFARPPNRVESETPSSGASGRVKSPKQPPQQLRQPPRKPKDGKLSRGGKRRSRQRVRRAMVLTHRWVSLVAGIILLAFTTSGSVLLYQQEIIEASNPSAYAAAGGSHRVSLSRALEIVKANHPKDPPASATRMGDVIKVATVGEKNYTVDSATGRELGEAHTPGWLEFLSNFHLCFLSCEGQVGYVSFMAAEIPHTAWLTGGEENATVASLIIGGYGLILLLLVITGLWAWWPRHGRWKASVTVRWGKGRFARDTDLHKVIGLVSLPLLFLWGYTAAAFEFDPVSKLWYAITPGTEQEAPEPVSEGKGKDIAPAEAVSAARAVAPGKLTGITLPDAEDPTSTYTVSFSDGVDPYAHGSFPGNVSIAVDRHSGKATRTDSTGKEPIAQTVWSWNYPLHSGVFMNGWWRIIWLVFSLMPLALAATGLSTWLVRHKNARRKREAAAARRKGEGTAGPRRETDGYPRTRKTRTAQGGAADRAEETNGVDRAVVANVPSCSSAPVADESDGQSERP